MTLAVYTAAGVLQDSTVSVVQATLNTIISAGVGALFGYAAGWIQDIRERRRRRKSLATFLLSELRAAEISLRVVYQQPVGVLPAETFQAFRMIGETLPLLKPATVASLVDFAAFIDSVRALQSNLADDRLDRANARIEIRIFAASGIQRVPGLKQALESEGESLLPFVPLDIPSDIARGLSPELPPSPFPDHPNLPSSSSREDRP